MKRDWREGAGILITFITASPSYDTPKLARVLLSFLMLAAGVGAGWLDVHLPRFITIHYVKTIRPHTYSRTSLPEMLLDIKMVEYQQFTVVQFNILT